MPAPKLNLLLDGERLDAEVLTQLSRLEVREGDEGPSLLALRFRLAQRPGGLFFPLDDPDLFAPARPIAVDLTAPGGLPTRVFAGYLSHVRPHFEAVEANCYVEVLAVDRGALMDVEHSVRAWPEDTRDDEVVRELFDRWELEATVETSTITNAADEQLLVQRGSDWRFLQRLAQRNGFHCWLELDGDSGEPRGYFGPLPLDREPQADLTMLRGGDNLVWFDVQQLALAPLRYLGAALDPLAKQLIRGDGEPELEALGDEGLGERVATGVRAGGVAAAQRWIRDPLPQRTAVEALARGRSELAGFLVEARGELDPSLYRGLLRAHQPVLVKGVGERLAGRWWVRAVRTTLDEGLLRQTFVLWRNDLGLGGGLGGREEFGREAEEVAPR